MKVQEIFDNRGNLVIFCRVGDIKAAILDYAKNREMYIIWSLSPHAVLVSTCGDDTVILNYESLPVDFTSVLAMHSRTGLLDRCQPCFERE